MALSRRQGLEYPSWHVDHRSASEWGMSTLASPGLLCRHLGREFMHVLFVLRGQKSKA